MTTPTVIRLCEVTKRFRVRRPSGPGVRARCSSWLFPRFDEVTAVDRVSFEIGEGERVAFIGPNGAGKSTTLKMLAGVLHPDAGVAEVLGLSPFVDRRALGYRVGTVFGQRSQLWYELPPRDSFGLFGTIYELPAAVFRDRLALLTETFELGGLLDKPVRELSLGERMRCEIAASLLHSPRILFLDEPTIGLDASAKAAIREYLRTQSEDDGATLLLTSHDTGDIERVCQRVIVIQRGRVLMDGPISALRQRYLGKRRITLLTESASLDIERPGLRVVSTAPYRTTLELDVREMPLGALVDAVSRRTTLRDLEVEDLPLDEIIRALYADAEREHAA